MAVDEPEIQAIFHEAVARQSGDERSRYLDEACANAPQLRARVEELLQAHSQAGGFFRGQPIATEIESIVEQPGSQIGPYKLLQEIGQGGMGVVYMAEQREPVKRRVALKIIKPGMDTRQVIARFEAERQALAMMDHPHIAKVFDAGTTGSGHPYFVMELVNGLPVTTYCDEHQLTPRERLELFVPICQAVQHAHQKGIIHRDLKPGNILVALYDAQPVPKIIDFGVAKATHKSLTEKTLFTQLGQVVGTLDYMSPEQAQRNQLDIDTRSDVYSLGVVLYELLTGDPPFDRLRLRSAAFDEILRIIREEEPPAPSTRLSSSERLPSIAANRKLAPVRLSSLVRGELDWIVMKALEKDRARRYESASELAHDLQRYLNDEAVKACPPTLGYRLHKYAHRHRQLLTVAVAVIGLLVAGTSVSSWQAVRARNAAQLAQTQAIQVISERDAKQKAWEQAVDNEARARTAANNERVAREAEAQQRREAEKERCRAEWNAYFQLVGHIQAELQRHDYNSAQRLFDTLPDRSRQWEYGYLQTQLRSGMRVLPHPGILGRVAFHPDGRRLASVSSTDESLCVWDTVTGQQLLRRPTPGLPAMSDVAFSADGRRLAVPGRCNSIHILDASSGNEVLTIGDCAGPVHSVTFSADGRWLASASEGDAGIQLWEASTGAPKFASKGQPWRVVFSPDSRFLAAGGPQEMVTLWDVATGEVVRQFTGFDRPPTGLAFSPDGQRLAASSAFGLTAIVWDTASGRERYSVDARNGDVWDVAFSPDGKLLATAGGGLDRTVRIWDAASGREIWQLRGHQNRVTSVCFSPDGRRVASAGYDGSARLWALTEGPGVGTVQGPAGFVLGADFSPDRTLVATTDEDGRVTILNALTGQLLHRFQGHSARTWAVAFSPDGSRIATGADDGVVKLWNPSSGSELMALPGSGAAITMLAFSGDGTRIAAASKDATIRIWESASGKSLLSFPVVTDPDLRGRANLRIAFHPTQPRLISVGPDRSVRVWDLTNGRKLHEQRHPAAIMSIAFSPDGTRLAMALEDESLVFWNISEDKLVECPGQVRGETQLAFSPNGERLVTASRDQCIRIWDPASGQEILALNGHSTEVRRIAFHQNGWAMIAISDAAVVKTWDAALNDCFAAPGEDNVANTAPDARQDAPPKHDSLDLVKLQGRWKLVQLQADGEEAP